MKTILLAVDGMTMDKKTLQYALVLCKPTRAGLDILQIVPPGPPRERYGKLKNRVLRVRDAFENAWTTAAFAEAGVPDLAGNLEKKAMRNIHKVLPAGTNTTVDYHCLVTGEDPDSELVRYVNAHRNVIMTIYDTLRGKHRKINHALRQSDVAKGLLNRLQVPLILVRDM